jgi:hypothetical protein
MVETEWRSLCVGKAALRQYILDTSRLLDGLILNPVGQEGCILGFLCSWSGRLFNCDLENQYKINTTSSHRTSQVTCSAHLSRGTSLDTSERHGEQPVPAFERARLPRTSTIQPHLHHPSPVDRDS